MYVWNILFAHQIDEFSDLQILFFIFQDPKVYVSTILGVHRKYNNLVMTAFNNDSGFVASLDKACGKFINNNSGILAIILLKFFTFSYFMTNMVSKISFTFQLRARQMQAVNPPNCWQNTVIIC